MPVSAKKGERIMVTVSVKGVLVGILLIALIVLVVFLIVLISNVTDTIKKANAIIDGGTNAAAGAKEKMDHVSDAVKEGASKVTGVASVGVKAAGKVLDKVIK
jgi:predicted PurR-regulated permease PerM